MDKKEDAVLRILQVVEELHLSKDDFIEVVKMVEVQSHEYQPPKWVKGYGWVSGHRQLIND